MCSPPAFGGLHGGEFINLEEGPITVRLTVWCHFGSHQNVDRAIDGGVLVNLDL